MSGPYAPDGYTRVTPYLTIKGAQKLLDFLVAVFDAEIVDRVEKPNGKLTQASVRIGDSHVELAEATEYGALCLARFTSTCLTSIKLTDGHSKTAHNRCMTRWKWITENAPLL